MYGEVQEGHYVFQALGYVQADFVVEQELEPERTCSILFILDGGIDNYNGSMDVEMVE